MADITTKPSILKRLRDPAGENNPSLRRELAIDGLEMVDSASNPRMWSILKVYLANSLMDLFDENRSEYIESAIEAFQQALGVLDLEQSPKEWGIIRANLGNAYADRIAGEYSDNLEKAILHYRDSLAPLRRHAPLIKWIRTMLNLGLTYQKRIAGDRNDNLKSAHSLYSRILENLDRDRMPEWWAYCMNNIGLIYWARTDGNRAEHLEKAISFFEQSLSRRDRRKMPGQWAESMINLGSAYFFRLKGERNSNLEKAISCSEAALEEINRETAPEQWYAVMGNLGAAYVDRVNGDRSENLEKGISILEQVQEVMDRPHPTCDFPTRIRVTIGIGNAYYHRISGNRSENLEKALKFYEEVVEILDREIYPLEWALTMNNLGNVYFRRISGDSLKNREQAILHYRKALEIRTPDKMPMDWAITVMNLGIAYSERVLGSRAENYEKAIDLHRQAFEVLTEENMPVEWARNKNNLGTAYIERVRGDRTENIENAILSYRQALKIRKRDRFPMDWAETTNNIANIYLYRMLGNASVNVEQAIELYNDVLSFRKKENLPDDWAETMHNLGIAWFNRRKGSREENLLKSISYFRRSLEIRTRVGMPEKWAKTMTNQGNAFIHLKQGERLPHIEKGIDCFEQALGVRKRDALPVEWAETQNNLGIACTERLRLTGDKAYKQKAVDAFEKALTVHTIGGMPEGYRLTQRNLGVVYFSTQDWEKALAAFSASLAAGELLYQSGAVTSARQSQLHGNRDASMNLAYCLSRLHRYHEAVEVIEKAKARALAEELSLSGIPLEKIRKQDRSKFLAVRQRIAELETEARSASHERVREYPEISSELSGTRGKLDELIGHIRSYAPEILNLDCDYEEIADIAGRLGHPLVYLVTTSQGSLSLIVSPDKGKMEENNVVWLNRFGEAVLDEMVYEQGERKRYLTGIVLGDDRVLKENLERMWSPLTLDLMDPVIEHLTASGWDRAWLISSGMLELLPLNALAAEKCAVSRVPSALVLRSCLQRAVTSDRGALSSFSGIYNPLPSDSPLPLASVEVHGIAAMFREKYLFSGREATRKNIGKSIADTNYLHFATHGVFDSNDILDSAILLSNNERLSLRDILGGKMDLGSVRLAVLSACQTGIIDFQKVPDEMIGMASGFLQTGVRGVISTLWPVQDVSTALLLIRFYHHHMKQGLSPELSLSRAQIWLRGATGKELAENGKDFFRSGEKNPYLYTAVRYFKNMGNEKPFVDPYYWAGFVFSGI